MNTKPILLVEDNPDDEALAIRAFKKSKMTNEIIVVRDGAEALDYLFAQGAHADRDASVLPSVMLLDLNLPKIDGLEVLRRQLVSRCTSTSPRPTPAYPAEIIG
jgi:two-component system response regulator